MAHRVFVHFFLIVIFLLKIMIIYDMVYDEPQSLFNPGVKRPLAGISRVAA